MKKLLPVLFLVMLVGCKNEAKYKQSLLMTVVKIETLSEGSAVWIDSYTTIWNRAIMDKTYEGVYCSDWNYAINDYSDKFHKSDSYKSMVENIKEIESNLKELKDCPSNYKDAYSEVVELYSMTYELFSYVDKPSGSLQSFSRDAKTLYNNINQKKKSISIKYLN